MKWLLPFLAVLGGVGPSVRAAPEATTPPAETDGLSVDDLYEAGKNLFEAYAPDEVKAEFEFPDKARWNDFFTRLQAALAGDDFAALARFEPDIQAALAALGQLPGSEGYAVWLEERLDYVQAAAETVRLAPPPAAAKPKVPAAKVPQLDLWVRRVTARPRPPRADKYVPPLRPIFAQGGVPRDLVWLAEVESSFNPAVRSPAGARGLFQLMPATAQSLGLRTFFPDERADPAKSAAAATRLLRELHAQFHDWPLALAAYNAGPGRVKRALEKKGPGASFADIAPALSVETRMYVPKVLATLQVRSGTVLPGK